jgi:hypothetical protein
MTCYMIQRIAASAVTPARVDSYAIKAYVHYR